MQVKQLKYIKYLILLFPLTCISCDFIKIKDTTSVVTPNHTISEDAKLISNSMSDVTKEDAKLMYMQFGGLSNYLSNTSKITNTVILFKIIDSFQSDYEYTREKYKNYTDTVEAFLLKRGYDDAKDIVSSVTDNKTQIARSQVIEDMQTLSDAAKIAMEKK